MPYDAKYFGEIRRGAESAAACMVSEVLKILSPRSVVDVGCGLGTWLAEFQKRGIPEVLGIDGDYVDVGQLVIDRHLFIARDLRRPLGVNRKFDLAISLEVAEHLSRECAERFVSDLVSLAPTVLFSAAVPFQHGENHVNEQWPDYWAQIFLGFGYIPLDCIRPRIWMDDQIDYWYRQNTILYVRGDYIESNPDLGAIKEQQLSTVLPLVHPEVYTARSQALSLSVGDLLRALPGAVVKAALRRLAPGLMGRKLGRQVSRSDRRRVDPI
jgi:SAM-dependent methyltransferase